MLKQMNKMVYKATLKLKNRDYSIPFGMSTIGRSSKSTTVLEVDGLVGGSISSIHAILYLDENGLCVEDNCSRNGTYINNERIGCTRTLMNGDKLGLGACELQVRVRSNKLLEGLARLLGR